MQWIPNSSCFRARSISDRLLYADTLKDGRREEGKTEGRKAGRKEGRKGGEGVIKGVKEGRS